MLENDDYTIHPNNQHCGISSFSLYCSWLPKVAVCYNTNTVDLSNVIASDGRKFILSNNRCGLCGMKNGYKTKCAAGRCHAHGEKNKPYHFHATCARQIGFEVAHRDDEKFVGKSCIRNKTSVLFCKLSR